MLRFLVAIDHSVESSFALRTACALARQTGAYLAALHVLDPAAAGLEYGAGWAVHTYKRERLQEAHLEMAEVIASEGEACKAVPDLKVVSGDPVKEIVRQASGGGFDFLFLGRVHPLEGPHGGIFLKLFSKIACPMVILRHYRPLTKALLVVGDREATEKAASKAESLLKGLPIQLDLVGSLEARFENERTADLEKTRERLLSAGLKVNTDARPADPMQEIPVIALEYDLAILGSRHREKPDPLIMRMLRAMPAPLMLCP